MFLAIDADILAYQAVSSAEFEMDWGGDIWSLSTDLAEAKDIFTQQVETIKDKTGIKKAVFCFSDHNDNFRKHVYPAYKSGRKKTRKPLGYKALCGWVAENEDVMRKPGLEADDVCGLISTRPENANQCVVVSNDKDLKTIPGQLYRPMNDEMLSITEQEADRNFLTQCLTGDSTDGYPGVPGIGPKKAEAVLGLRPHWGAVEQAYIAAGLTKDDAIQQARLARILRWSDWDADQGELILWTPPHKSSN